MKIAALTTFVCLGLPFAAWAQAVAPAGSVSPSLASAAPAGQSLGGPVIAGVCLLSQEAVMVNAKVGKVATARLKEIFEVAQSEVGADRAQLNFDAEALESQRAKLNPEEYKQKQQALAGRLQALEQKAALRNREVEATRQKALGRIALAAQPVIADVYKSRNCGLLVNRNTVLGGNFANDLTADVVAGLDARITTITFDREEISDIPTAGK